MGLLGANVFKSPKTLGCVFVYAATDQLRRSQAKVFALAGNEGLDGKLFARHEASSFSFELRRTAEPPLLVATFVTASRFRGFHLARGWQVGAEL
jgi:hypothetical protein